MKKTLKWGLLISGAVAMIVVAAMEWMNQELDKAVQSIGRYR